MVRTRRCIPAKKSLSPREASQLGTWAIGDDDRHHMSWVRFVDSDTFFGDAVAVVVDAVANGDVEVENWGWQWRWYW